MVQPIQYQLPGVSPDPFAGVLQGLKIGATLSELDAMRAQRALQQQELQRKMEQQRLANEAFSKFRDIPFNQARSSDIAGLLGYAPAEMINALTKLKENQTAEQNANAARNYGQMLSAVKSGNPQEAINLANTLAEAATDEATKQGYRALARGFEKAPDAAAKQIALGMMGLGDKYVDIAKKILDQEDRGRMISTPEAKIEAGLVNDKGKPLPGTFFQEPGKEPKLVSGEKPDADTETVRTMRALGYPITEAGFKAYSEQKRAPAVQVSVGAGQKAEDIEFGKYLVDEFKQVSSEANVADKLLGNIAVTKKVLNDPKFVTGRGAEFTAAAAGFLSALGVKDATKYAANAEIFTSQANQVTLNKFLEQKGVQTNQDGIRVDNTFALLKNTKDANKFIVAFAESTAQRAKDKRKFFTKYRVQNKTLDGAAEAWETSFEGSKSIFDYPAMRPFRNIQAPPAPAPARPAAAAPAPVTPAPPPGFGPRAVTGTVTPAASFPVAPQPATPTESTEALIERMRRKYGQPR